MAELGDVRTDVNAEDVTPGLIGIFAMGFPPSTKRRQLACSTS
jgi:hypothetical protein